MADLGGVNDAPSSSSSCWPVARKAFSDGGPQSAGGAVHGGRDRHDGWEHARMSESSSRLPDRREIRPGVGGGVQARSSLCG